MSVITRSITRRVRFADQPGDGRPTEWSDESVENQEYETCGRRTPIQPNPDTQGSSSAEDIDPTTVQKERRERISTAQDKEMKWSDLKTYLRGEFDKLTHRQASEAEKITDRFVLSQDGLLYYVGRRRELIETQENDQTTTRNSNHTSR